MDARTLEILGKLRKIEKETWDSKYWRGVQQRAKAEGKTIGPSVGASEQAIQTLIEYAGTDLPSDYLDFLKLSDGLLGDLYSIEEIIKDRYRVREFMPGGIAIGNNGGLNLYILNTRSEKTETMEYVKVSTMGLGWRDIYGRWNYFYDLIEYMFRYTLEEDEI